MTQGSIVLLSLSCSAGVRSAQSLDPKSSLVFDGPREDLSVFVIFGIIDDAMPRFEPCTARSVTRVSPSCLFSIRVASLLHHFVITAHRAKPRG